MGGSTNPVWDYTIFGVERPAAAPDEQLDLLFEKVPGAAAATTDGRSTESPADTNPLFTTATGKHRYRLAMDQP